MEPVSSCFGAAALALSFAAAVTDVRTGLIPNKLTLPALALAPVAACFAATATQGASAGLLALKVSVLGVFATSLLPLALFVRGELGGGDVKLLAALGALLGPFAGFNALTFGLVAASVFVLCRAIGRGELPSWVRRAWSRKREPSRRGDGPTLRLGPALCLGTCAGVFFGPHALIVW